MSKVAKALNVEVRTRPTPYGNDSRSQLNPTNPVNLVDPVDSFIARQQKWQDEFRALRSIILKSESSGELTEGLKWGVPCYSYQGRNVFLIHGFKDYCAILFIKGSLLEDPARVFVQQTANVQAGRQIRFTTRGQIDAMEPVLRDYIARAIELEKSGQKVQFKGTDSFPLVPEFQQKLDADPALTAAFSALTPGRQRAYLLYFAQPKRAQTRLSRIEKSLPQILAGKGLHE
ncbi:MAG TPA: DUF1801 domain-containing protein [Spirochaetales bacterium]|nr:DUF1801 domain-containing protein [Spirochaetales bacterium]